MVWIESVNWFSEKEAPARVAVLQARIGISRTITHFSLADLTQEIDTSSKLLTKIHLRSLNQFEILQHDVWEFLQFLRDRG